MTQAAASRVRVVERRMNAVHPRDQKKFRTVMVRDDDPEPKAGPDEELLILRVIDTKRRPMVVRSDDDLAVEVADLERELADLKAKT